MNSAILKKIEHSEAITLVILSTLVTSLINNFKVIYNFRNSL